MSENFERTNVNIFLAIIFNIVFGCCKEQFQQAIFNIVFWGCSKEPFQQAGSFE